ncbi:MAG: carboxypeptidase-like regulatory domain-containing protein [Actinomycetota bacterium]
MKIMQILVLVFGLFVVVNAQNVSERLEKSNLSGTVFDETGAVITQTKVAFTSKTGKVFNTVTNQDGIYQIELNEGNYLIEFYKEGFKPYKFENYKLAFRSKMQLDVSLDVGAMIDTYPIRSKKKKRKI